MKYQKWFWLYGFVYGLLLSVLSIILKCVSCIVISAPPYLFWLMWLLYLVTPIYWMLIGSLLSSKKSFLAFILFLIAILFHYVGVIGVGIMWMSAFSEITVTVILSWGVVFVVGQVAAWYFAIKIHVLD